MKKLIILGGSGIGMSVAAIATQDLTIETLGFLNDILPIGYKVGKFTRVPVIGTTDDINRYLKDEDTFFFIAYVGMQHEEEVYKKIESLNIPTNRYYSAIHPTAVYPKGFCSIGNGVLLTALSQVGVDAVISDNCMLLANSYVGHDSFLDRFAHIATNAVVGANVHVGKAVHVGSNATIREKITIGDFSLIGAGAVVIEDVPPNSIVVGNPARVLRTKKNV
ncbi:NeuD/PglB/VioB family sugar acetyltransferase [Parablautia muri]|uniref:PglD N-terminal domain-containing protein n=1 Tax=Parablautia muri TaxID=2320879 RepID=A0A9X5GRS3_9FIRM|nr:NeuD/PglB/VioB family sugar acetyltransferase [Parablautia muri]NBJ91362.1 hypothetical protein [Parablautia muri]